MQTDTKAALCGILIGFVFGVLLMAACLLPPPAMRSQCQKACRAEGHKLWVIDHWKGCICADPQPPRPKKVWSIPPPKPRTD